MKSKLSISVIGLALFLAEREALSIELDRIAVSEAVRVHALLDPSPSCKPP